MKAPVKLYLISPREPCGVTWLINCFLAHEQNRMHMTSTLQELIDESAVPIAAVKYSGEWGEVDSQTGLQHYAGNQRSGCRHDH